MPPKDPIYWMLSDAIETLARGLVLPVGGIKEKVVAAAAAVLTRVMPPARNRRGFDGIPLSARNRLEFIWLERVDDAVARRWSQRPRRQPQLDLNQRQARGRALN